MRKFEIGERDFLLDGKPIVLRVGEIHLARVPHELWRHRLKACRAMGLNAVCAYLFWNFHERKPGEFTFTGEADVAEFCRIAQEEGLHVLLRPGPYTCAEWEMGGLPWWLLKNQDIKLRTRDPRYMEAARRYLLEVGKQLAPLQVTNGGPILMVQIENEYGFYGSDEGYMTELRDIFLEAGFTVPLFACNPTAHLGRGTPDGLFEVANFGSDPEEQFKRLRAHQPRGPQMCGEYYAAWFDTWGYPHRTKAPDEMLRDLESMLKNRQSFSIYMAHGGTSFGFWAGADGPFKPDTTSYDYDAPIAENGSVTPKFWKLRELFGKYLNPGETLTEPPASTPIIEIAPFKLQQSAPLWSNLPTPIKDETPRSFEAYDQSRGVIVYETDLPTGAAGSLQANEIRDFGWVYLDGKLLGVFDRRSRRRSVLLPARTKSAKLQILVEAMGRVNFGEGVHDRKGLGNGVQVLAGETSTELKNWRVHNLPFSQSQLAKVKFETKANAGPAFWRGEFQVQNVGDTYLDTSGWGKGVLWVNGHCLGRFWNIGPTQTMYCPGVWLKKGRNDVQIVDLLGPQNPTLAGLKAPVLDNLRRELDFARSARALGTFKTDVAPIFSGAMVRGTQVQQFEFPQNASGRYLCFESTSALDDGPFAALSELNALDTNKQPLSRGEWRVVWTDSEETASEDGSAENALDGQNNSFWHTQWSQDKPAHPHRLVIDLGSRQTVSGVRLLQRPGANVGGMIKDFRVYLSDAPFGLQVN